jgi:hypothetical protein
MSGKMVLLVQCCVTICVFVLVVHGEKRLLLSDPDVVNDRLLQMEREMQKLTGELKSHQQDATNKMASFTTELGSYKRQTRNLASKIATLEQSSSGKSLCGILLRYCPSRT